MASFCSNEGGVYRVTLGNRLPHMEFILDSAAELASLPTNKRSAIVGDEEIGPCAPGSVALIPLSTSTSEIYMLNCNGEWCVM